MTRSHSDQMTACWTSYSEYISVGGVKYPTYKTEYLSNIMKDKHTTPQR